MKALTLRIRQNNGRGLEYYIPPAQLFPVRVGRSVINTDIAVEDAQQSISRHQLDIVGAQNGYSVINRGRALMWADNPNPLEQNASLPIKNGLVLTAAYSSFEFALTRELKPSCVLTLQCGEQENVFKLCDNQFVRIGSDKTSNEIVMPNEYGVSANHLRVSVGAGHNRRIHIHEVKSRNGIFVQDKEAPEHLVRVEEAQIEEGCPFYFGKVRGTVVACGDIQVSLKKSLLLAGVVACLLLGLFKAWSDKSEKTPTDKPPVEAVIDGGTTNPINKPPVPDNETLYSRWERIKDNTLEEKITSIEIFQTQAQADAKLAAVTMAELLKAHVSLDKTLSDLNDEWERLLRRIKEHPWKTEAYSLERLALAVAKEQFSELNKKEAACSNNHFLKTQRIDVVSGLSGTRQQAEAMFSSLSNHLAAAETARKALTAWGKEPWSFTREQYGQWREAAGQISAETAGRIEGIENFCLSSQDAWRDLFEKLEQKTQDPVKTFDVRNMPDIKDLDVLGLPVEVKKTVADDAARSGFLELRGALRQTVADSEACIQWANQTLERLKKWAVPAFIAANARAVDDKLHRLIKGETDKILAESEVMVRKLKKAIDAKDALLIAGAVIPPETMEIYLRNLSEENRGILNGLNLNGLALILDACEKLHAEGEQIKNIDPETFQKKLREARGILEQLRKNYKNSELPQRVAKVWRWCSQK